MPPRFAPPISPADAAAPTFFPPHVLSERPDRRVVHIHRGTPHHPLQPRPPPTRSVVSVSRGTRHAQPLSPRWQWAPSGRVFRTEPRQPVGEHAAEHHAEAADGECGRLHRSDLFERRDAEHFVEVRRGSSGQTTNAQPRFTPNCWLPESHIFAALGEQARSAGETSKFGFRRDSGGAASPLPSGTACQSAGASSGSRRFRNQGGVGGRSRTSMSQEQPRRRASPHAVEDEHRRASSPRVCRPRRSRRVSCG